jgi:hypothetical protein
MPRVSQIQKGRYNPPLYFDVYDVEQEEWVPVAPIPDYPARCAFERLYDDLRVERLDVEGCMRVESDGRGFLPVAPSTVNASEVRYSPRPRVRANRDETSDYLDDDDTLDRRGMGAYVRYTMPTWFLQWVLTLDVEAKTRLLDRWPSVEVADVEVEVERKSSTARPLDVGSEHTARLLDIVGNADVEGMLSA